VKLVRGAYHPHETAAHPAPGAPPAGKGKPQTQTLSISPEVLPPVWGEKTDTDAAYDACAGLLLDAVAADVASERLQSVGLLFGTHNWASCKKIMAGLTERGLAESTPEGKLRVTERVGERVTFGQLYGALFPRRHIVSYSAVRPRHVRRPHPIPRESHGVGHAHGH
jgi:proline dehydrogenase